MLYDYYGWNTPELEIDITEETRFENETEDINAKIRAAKEMARKEREGIS